MKKARKVTQIIIFILLSAVLAVMLFVRHEPAAAEEPAGPEQLTASSEDTLPPPPPPTPTPAPAPTPTPTPTPTPEPEYFTISVIGDCTLSSHQNLGPDSPYSYAGRMQGDWSYPFANTAEYFLNDDLTIANLECTLTDEQLSPSPSAQFYFRTPTEYVNILLEGGVDFVTTANNHMMDFGEAGRDSTYAALESYSMPFGKEGEKQIYELESGLRIGIYCDHNNYIPNKEKCCAAIEELKSWDADYVICAFHWGVELNYRPNETEIDLAHACIDAGADLIYGSHSHCLQPYEEYNGGLILYSMGNWSFGGNTTPKDPDTAIVQVKVKRDTDGSVSTDGFEIIPCCISSQLEAAANNEYSYNDYRPTPYPEDSEQYARAMSKIDGSYDGPDGTADYSQWYQSWG